MDDSDTQPELVRLSKVARECNVALYAIIEELAAKGVPVEANPNAKIPYALYQELLSAFQQDKEMRERSREAFELHKARYPDPPSTVNPSDMNAVWIIEKGLGRADALMLVHDAADQQITAAGLASVLDETVEDRKRKEENMEDHIILIDIFLAFNDPEYQHHQDLGGIALLKFLRIKEVNNHIVLLSPWNLQQLLRMKPGYHILASKGITIAQYTYSIDELRTHDGVEVDTTKLAKEKAPPKEQLRDYFKAGISLPKDERHNWAQWWGAERLRVMWNSSVEAPRQIPEVDAIEQQLRLIRNAELSYMYGGVRSDIRSVDAPKSGLAKDGQVVLYIDDNHGMGWSSVLGRILFDDPKNEAKRLKTDCPKPGENLPDLTKRLLNKVGSMRKDLALVLLDLRLLAEGHEVGDPDLSGAVILRQLRSKWPTIPVVVLTATSRGSTHVLLKEQGAFAVLTKPSIEDASKQGNDAGALDKLIDALRSSIEHSADPVVRDYAAAELLVGRMNEWNWEGLASEEQRVVERIGTGTKHRRFKKVLVDTNFFIHEDCHLIVPILYCMAKDRSQRRLSPLVIVDKVFLELFHFAHRPMEGLDQAGVNASRAARIVFPWIVKWLQDGLIAKQGDLTNASNRYADPQIIDSIDKYFANKPDGSLLFLSNDQECQRSANEIFYMRGLLDEQLSCEATWDIKVHMQPGL